MIADPSMQKILLEASKIEKVRKTAQNLRKTLEEAERSKGKDVDETKVSREIKSLQDKLSSIASDEHLSSETKEAEKHQSTTTKEAVKSTKALPHPAEHVEKARLEETRDNSWLVAPKQDQWGQELSRGSRKTIEYYDYGVHQKEPSWKYHPEMKQEAIDFRQDEKQFAKLPVDSSWNLVPSAREHAWKVAPPSRAAGVREQTRAEVSRGRVTPAVSHEAEEGGRRKEKIAVEKVRLPSPPPPPAVRPDERVDGPLARTAATLKMLMREAMARRTAQTSSAAAPQLQDKSFRSRLMSMHRDFDQEAQAERRVEEQLRSFGGLGGVEERPGPSGLLV